MVSQLPLFPIELLVEQEYKQVDVDGGPVKELHHGHAFILQLQEILGGTVERLQGGCCYSKTEVIKPISCLFQSNPLNEEILVWK
jgi:hypothetical protein